MMGRSRAATGALSWLAGLLMVMAASAPVRADGRVQFLSERLRYPPPAGQSNDFRVRTNAALALGATNDDEAVGPLCAGLADPSEVVRQAVAVALKRLARSVSADCLHRRLAVEPNVAVRLQIQHALERVDAPAGRAGAGSGGDVRYVANAKYYVSISPIANRTTRSGTEIDRGVREAIISKLGQLGDYQLAPAGESNEAAKAAIAKRKLKGFYLAVSVDELDYTRGSLSVRLKIAVFSYPGRDLKGEVPAEATLAGATPGDSDAEDQLIGLVASKAAEDFAQNFR